MNNFTKLSIAAALVLLAAGCTKEAGEFSGRRVQRTFTATLDESVTRTALDGSGKTIWKAGDQILYFGTDAVVGTHTVGADGAATIIGADLAVSETAFSAVYGASAVSDITADSFVLSGVVPAEQEGTFPSAHVSVARTTDLASGVLAFKNLTGLVKFSLSRKDVKYAVFSSNNLENLTGGGTVTVAFDSEGIPAATLGKTRSTSIKVNVPADGVCYISLLPTTLAQGFTLKCYDENGVRLGVAGSDKQVVVKRSHILNLGTLDVENRLSEPEDICNLLGSFETANCYIVPALKDYKFKATVKGNSAKALDGTPVSADVLWESTNDGAACAVGDVVSDVWFEAGYIYFSANSAGSAIVAVRDEGGNILWSWHLWVWPGYTIVGAMQEYYRGAGSMMDRNLGAQSVTPGERKAWGLCYQWGRKDPFVGGVTTPVGSTYETAVVCSQEVGNVEYTIAHPTTFIAYSDVNPGDWMYVQDDTLWSGDEKTIYDPCPPGWRMPSADFWVTALGRTSSFYKEFDLTLGGMDFGGQLGAAASIWYPAGGYRTGNIQYALYPQSTYLNGQWWSAGTTNRYGNNFATLRTNQVTVKGINAPRANGCSVRCVTDYVKPAVHVTSVTLNTTSLELSRFKTAKLSVTVAPADADDASVEWTSDNEAVATVSQDGLVTAVSVGNATIKVASVESPSVFASCTVTVTKEQDEVFSDSEAANCYVVSHAGTYRFKALKGNSGDAVATPDGAVLLWETFGTSSYNSRTPVVEYDSISYEDGYVSFDVPSNFHDGNAVIGVFKDGTGGSAGVFDLDYDEVLWSWHIWACKGFEPLESAHTYSDGSVVMDRNLGATSATPGTVGALGLLYQWGRKDPFPGPSTIDGANVARLSDSLEDPVASDPSTGTVDYAVKHPTAFITTSGSDWMYVANNSLWASAKTMYDPCPYGWRVPDGGPEGLWMKAAGVEPENADQSFAITWDETNCGSDYAGVFGSASSIWYPATGIRFRTSGSITNYKMYGAYWSATPSNDRSYILYQYSPGNAQLSGTFGRGEGIAIRCVRSN